MELLIAQRYAMIAALACLGSSLTRCTESSKSISLNLSEAFICYQYTNYSNAAIRLNNGSSELLLAEFPIMIVPYYSGTIKDDVRGFTVIEPSSDLSALSVFEASDPITITLLGAKDKLFYKTFSLIPA